jgi:hypothetical protein
MSVASLDFNTLNLTELTVGNDVYSDAVGYINTNTTITTTENSSIISTGGLYSSGLITGDNGLDISGNVNISGNLDFTGNLDISGNITSNNLSSVGLFNSTGNALISGVGFFTLAGPIVVGPSSSTLTTELFPFPSSSITQIIVQVGPINVSSGGIVVSAGVIAPFSDINSTVKFLFYNPTLNSITISTCSVILYNPLSNGGLQNITI